MPRFILIMRDSWLNPKGEIIEVGDFQHNEYASEILEAEFGDLEKLRITWKKITANMLTKYCI